MGGKELALMERKEGAESAISAYRKLAETTESQIQQRISESRSRRTIGLQSVAIAPKKVQDWIIRTKSAEEYEKKIYSYWDICDSAKADVGKLKSALGIFSIVGGPEFVGYALGEFAKSRASDFVEWAKASRDKDVRLLGKAVLEVAEASASLQEKLPKINELEKTLRVETALSVAVAIASVVPTGGIAAKAAGRAAEAGAGAIGGIFAKEGVKKGLTFGGGFMLDNLMADFSAIALTGADPARAMKEALPSYILGVGMIGGTKALASALSRDGVRELLRRAKAGESQALEAVPVRRAAAEAAGEILPRNIGKAKAAILENIGLVESQARRLVREYNEEVQACIREGRIKSGEDIVRAARKETLIAARELEKAAEKINAGRALAQKGIAGPEAMAYLTYEKAYRQLKRTGFSDGAAEAVALFTASSEAKGYSFPGHQLRVSELVDFISGERGYDNRFSVLHDMGKAVLSEGALKGKSALHRIGNPAVDIGVKEMHTASPYEIIETLRRSGAMSEGDNALYRKNIALFERAFDHHVYSMPKSPPLIKADIEFADSLDAAFSVRAYMKGEDYTASRLYNRASGFVRDEALGETMGKAGMRMDGAMEMLERFNARNTGRVEGVLRMGDGELEGLAASISRATGNGHAGAFFKNLAEAGKLAAKNNDRNAKTVLDYAIGNIMNDAYWRWGK